MAKQLTITRGRKFRVAPEPLTTEGTDVAPSSRRRYELSAIGRAVEELIAAALMALAVADWLVVGYQTLKPLSDMARQATTITERAPTARLRTPNTHDELGRLSMAFNGLLDRLAAALHLQRQFMADASHELRTPVSVVRTTAEVTLRRSARPECEYREALTIVGEQAVRLARLVEAMLLLSRAEADGLPLIREPLYMDDLLGECVRALRVLADERRVKVEATGDTEVAFSADTGLMRQMVGNLLDNAIRHARQSGTVTASLHRVPGAIVLRVTDDGDGIPVKDHGRIFQRFVRVSVASKGAGLGLPIARKIAEAHGGELILESSTAEGSIFTATLPSV